MENETTLLFKDLEEGDYFRLEIWGEGVVNQKIKPVGVGLAVYNSIEVTHGSTPWHIKDNTKVVKLQL